MSKFCSTLYRNIYVLLWISLITHTHKMVGSDYVVEGFKWINEDDRLKPHFTFQDQIRLSRLFPFHTHTQWHTHIHIIYECCTSMYTCISCYRNKYRGQALSNIQNTILVERHRAVCRFWTQTWLFGGGFGGGDWYQATWLSDAHTHTPFVPIIHQTPSPIVWLIAKLMNRCRFNEMNQSRQRPATSPYRFDWCQCNHQTATQYIGITDIPSIYYNVTNN